MGVNALAQHSISKVDQRSELNDPSHLQRINPGQDQSISQKSVNVQTRQGRDAGRDGWRRQEQIQEAIGFGWENALSDPWQDFQNGGGKKKRQSLSRGSVEVDKQPTMKPTWPGANQSFKVDQNLSGWERTNLAHDQAAKYEEHQRPLQRQLGRSNAPGGRTLMIRV